MGKLSKATCASCRHRIKRHDAARYEEKKGKVNYTYHLKCWQEAHA